MMKFPSTSKEFRTKARSALKGNYWIALLASLIASIFGVSSGTSGVSFESDEINNNPILNIPEKIQSMFITIVVVVLIVSLITAIVMFFLGSIVSTGYAKFKLDLVNNQKVSIGIMFSYFKHWKRLAYINFLVGLRIFLWSLLFIIPGIIAVYSYAAVPYILSENPNLSAKEVLKLSKTMMSGNRFRLFCLQFSFIGWILLSILTLGVGSIFLAPYQATAEACFYKEISEYFWKPLNRIDPNNESKKEQSFDDEMIFE